MLVFDRKHLYGAYLISISAIGILLCIWGLVDYPTYQPLLNFFLFVGLAAISSIASTAVSVSEESGILYATGHAIGLAAVPIFGIPAGIVIAAVYSISAWLFKPADERTWRKSYAQLAFNTGMHSISLFVAGGVLLLSMNLFGPSTLLGQSLPWLIAAYILEEVNFWLLAIILRLQHGPKVNLLQIWKDDHWATQIGAISLAIGSAVLAYAAQNFEWIGVIIFYLPIVLSTYAYRLYVRQMQTHLDNLEQIVADRTKELAERVEEVAELNRQKDAFLAVLSHDMITPLTSIQMYAEFLIEEPEAAMENPHLAHVMLRSQQAVYNLVRNIVDLEKLNSGGSLSSKKSVCDLIQIVYEAVEIVGAEARDKDITLQYHPGQESITVRADYQQMQRVFLNLASNAVKYTPSKGNVIITANAKATCAEIIIRDNGYGISADELPYIFDRFRRVDKLKDKAVGTGLGLAIVKALIEEHGGTIEVKSEVGVGTEFSVHLPLQEASSI